ncbi:MAG: DsbA family protein [Candidatus Kapabacteria bacterium]|nr:DsbA family protein [Candidatus Kapabacteria bacterium]
MDSTERPALHYFQDTLCGWCYGFGPVAKRLYEEWGNRLDFHVYAGGMITGDSVGSIGKKAAYIETGYKQVEELTGVRFGDVFVNDILAKGELILESTTPARALVVFRQFQPDNVVYFSHRLQQALYRDGLDLSHDDTYRRLAIEAELHPENFVELMHSEAVGNAVAEEFEYVASLGIGGFPTLLYSEDDQAHLLSQGYASFDDIDTMLRVITKTM